MLQFILHRTCQPQNECCDEPGNGRCGEYSWQHWNDKLLAVKLMLADFYFNIIWLLKIFFFSQLCLFPSSLVHQRVFVILLAEQWLSKCRPLAKCLVAGTVEQMLCVQMGQSTGRNRLAWTGMLLGSTATSFFVVLSAAGSSQVFMAIFNSDFVCLVFHIDVLFLLLLYCK